MFAELPILDPLLSIAFTLFILVNVSRNFWTTLKLFAQSTPDATLGKNIGSALKDIEGINNVHHLHLWSLDGENHVLTAHLTLKEALDSSAQMQLKEHINTALEHFHLQHTTIELEWPDEICRDGSM